MAVNPSKKGWLKEYLEFRKGIFQSFYADATRGSHPEESLYQFLRPNGLLYGHPILRNGFAELTAEMPELQKIKILMAESLINGSLILQHRDVSTAKEFSEVILNTVQNIGEFYNKVYPELSVPSRTIFGRRKSSLEIAEATLDKRVKLNKDKGDFWANFFNNSLLFLDIYFFSQWMHANMDRNIAVFFKTEKEALRFSVVKVITAAAHANKNIEDEEQGLFDYFLSSSHLNTRQKKEAQRIFQEGVTLEELELPTHNSWILKKYFLELAILTVWSDRKLEDSEYNFLKDFNDSLGFYEEDLENSLLAVEGFVLEHWEYLEALRTEHDYNEVSKEYVEHIKKLINRNSMHITSEIEGNSDLSLLLRKARSADLTDEEAIKLKEELLSVLKKVPTFVIIGLPTAFLTLPMLIKVLPDSLMPGGK